MAEITLTVDATQAQQALKAVNRAITLAKINGATIKLDGKDVTNLLNKMREAAKKTGDTILKTTTDQAQKATKGIKGVTNLFGKGVSQIRSFLSGAVSWWTALIIAIEVAAKTFKYFWDNLTLSTTKMTTRAQNAIKIALLAKKKIQLETTAAQDLISKLDELNKILTLNVELKRLAESIVTKLNNQYKDLGITLDQTTGKYKGLYEAQRKIDERNKSGQASALKNQIQAQRDVINAALKTAFGSQLNIGENVKGSDFFTIALRLGKTLGSQTSDILAKKWNTKDITQQLEVIDQLLNGLSSGEQFMLNGSAVRDAMQQLIDYKKQLQELNSIDTQIVDAETRLTNAFKAQRDALKSTRELVEKLNKSYEDQQKSTSLAGLDPEDRANALRSEVEQLKKKNELLQKTLTLKKELSDYINLNANVDQREFNRINEQRRTIEKQISELQKKQNLNDAKRANKLQSRGDALIAGNSWISKEQFQSGFDNPWLLQRRIESAIQSYKDLNMPDVYKPKSDIEDLQLMLKYIRTYNDLYNDNTLIQAKLVKAKKELNQLNEQAQKYLSSYALSEKTRLENQQSIADLEKERAENALEILAKEQLIALIETQLAKERADAELKAWLAEQQRIQSYSDFVNDLMNKLIEGLNEIIGMKKDNLLLLLQINAEKIRGRKLTEELLDALKSYVDVMTMQDQIKAGQKLNLLTNGVITNDLARKGGWASSVVVDRAQDINRLILGVLKSQLELMTSLNETMNRSNELLKQFSVIQ